MTGKTATKSTKTKVPVANAATTGKATTMSGSGTVHLGRQSPRPETVKLKEQMGMTGARASVTKPGRLEAKASTGRQVGKGTTRAAKKGRA